MIMGLKNVYEKYHRDRKIQKKVIDSHDFTYKNLLRFIDKYAKRKKKILDIGCGVGTIDLYLAKANKHVVGIDISQNGIKIAKKNAQKFGLSKSVRYVVANFPTEAPKGKFDLIICSEILEHIKQDKLAVIKIRNLLNNNGLVITSSPSKNAPLYRIGLLGNFDKMVGHLRRYTVGSYTRLFKNSGLQVLETKKTEGILRNFLFTNIIGGFLLRILNKRPFSTVVSFLDELTIPIFGESNIYLVAQKK